MALSPDHAPSFLVPLIDDMIRTRFCVSGSVFLVEGVDVLPIAASKRWRAIRLLLGDGELCIQALLDGPMHRFVETGDVAVGSYVQVHEFELKQRYDFHGDIMSVYLVLYDLATVGWNERARAAKTISSPQETALQVTSLGQRVLNENDESLTGLPVPYDPCSFEAPLRLTTLRFVAQSPGVENCPHNLLVILVSLSPVEATGSSLQKQRTARIGDPSTSKQVILTVFHNPEEFAPAVGSAVLLIGVTVHQSDGGGLAKYADEKDVTGIRWWLENPWHLGWCDVAGIKRWWAGLKS